MRRIKWTTAKSPEYVCARHRASRTDVGLASFFLCENCITLLRKHAFNNTEPAYQSESTLIGFCTYCGNKINVKQIFWYLCTICDRVIRSFAIERASSEFLLNWWNQNRQTVECTKSIRLEVTDPVRLTSFDPSDKSKGQPTDSKPDFIGVDEHTGGKIFAIEMKTGRNAINKMSAFQLDVSDCDDILAFVQSLKIPSYLFHVWVVDEYEPPTSRKMALDAWWMSVFDMEANFQQIRQRPREQRPAAYFKRTGFKLKEDFLKHVCSNELQTFKEELAKRLPILYVLPEK